MALNDTHHLTPMGDVVQEIEPVEVAMMDDQGTPDDLSDDIAMMDNGGTLEDPLDDFVMTTLVHNHTHHINAAGQCLNNTDVGLTRRAGIIIVHHV